MRRQKGFSLIEMAVALLVITFIIGGIVAGQALIRAGELRAAISEAQKHTQLIHDFREKYHAFPGDFAGATGLWSGTANGDGNGRITTYGSGSTYIEQFLAWQHLSLAGMTEGAFTGAAGGGGARDRVAGENIPSSKLPGGGWGLISVTLHDVSLGYSDIPYITGDTAPGHVLWLGGRTINPTSGDTQAPVLTGGEALDIDQKIDDGVPNRGKIVAQSGASCFTGGAYVAVDNTRVCALVFKTGF